MCGILSYALAALFGAAVVLVIVFVSTFVWAVFK